MKMRMSILRSTTAELTELEALTIASKWLVFYSLNNYNYNYDDDH
jgi:hypothetical protein